MNISKIKADIEKISSVKSVLFLIFHRKTKENWGGQNFYENFFNFFKSFFLVEKKSLSQATPNRLKRTLKQKKNDVIDFFGGVGGGHLLLSRQMPKMLQNMFQMKKSEKIKKKSLK